MLRGLRTFALLDGFRGRPPADLRAIEDVILRVGALAAGHPQIAELDCNPVVAAPDRAVVVNAKVRLGSAARGRALRGPGSRDDDRQALTVPKGARRARRPRGGRRGRTLTGP